MFTKDTVWKFEMVIKLAIIMTVAAFIVYKMDDYITEFYGEVVSYLFIFVVYLIVYFIGRRVISNATRKHFGYPVFAIYYDECMKGYNEIIAEIEATSVIPMINGLPESIISSMARHEYLVDKFGSRESRHNFESCKKSIILLVKINDVKATVAGLKVLLHSLENTKFNVVKH